jgi:hypothetical protein
VDEIKIPWMTWGTTKRMEDLEGYILGLHITFNLMNKATVKAIPQ